MQIQIKKHLDHFTTILLLLSVALIFGSGCATPDQDPLVGWKPDFTSRASDQVIERDYEDYIKSLPSMRNGFVGSVEWFKDETGQHAVKIRIGRNGTWRVHVLMYNNENRRVNVITYKDGGYRS